MKGIFNAIPKSNDKKVLHKKWAIDVIKKKIAPPC